MLCLCMGFYVPLCLSFYRLCNLLISCYKKLKNAELGVTNLLSKIQRFAVCVSRRSCGGGTLLRSFPVNAAGLLTYF